MSDTEVNAGDPTDDTSSETCALNPLEIEKVQRIVEEATTAKVISFPKNPVEHRLDVSSKWLMRPGIAGFITMVVLAVVAYYTHSRVLANATFVVSVIVQLITLGVLSIIIFSGILFLWQLKKSPFGPFFSQLKASRELNLPYVFQLAACDKQAVQYVLAHYKYERAGFEKRGSLLAGSVERVGLFPALAALVLLVAGLEKVTELGTWPVMFGPIIFAFYLMNVASFNMLQKMDRVIGLLEFCIQSRK